MSYRYTLEKTRAQAVRRGMDTRTSPRALEEPSKEDLRTDLAEIVRNTVAISFADPPFACPPDTILDIPVPPSVNETRKINPAAIPMADDWKASADTRLMASGQYREANRNRVKDKFEVKIVLCEKQCRKDLDNICKSAIDYLRRIELIRDDSPKYMRKLTVEWGEAPAGCRIVLRGAA